MGRTTYYGDFKDCIGCAGHLDGGKPSARFDHGMSYDSRCTRPDGGYCVVYDTYWVPFTGRRTPSDRFTITARGGPTTAGGSDTGRLYAGGGIFKGAAMQGDTTATLTTLAFADNTEVPVPGRVSGPQWNFQVLADGTAYDVASFDVTYTTYVPAS